MKKSMCFAGIAAVAALGTSASAGMIVHSGSLPLASTNWSVDFDVPQFDTMGGLRVLDEVCWTLTGKVQGTAMAESLDAEPAVVSLTLQAAVSLSLGMTVLDVVLPLVNTMFNASAFDGNIDFGGTSGATFADLMNTDSVMNSTAMVAPFIGNGVVTLTGAADGTSSGSGAGNLITQFMTSASLDWEIVYKYSEIPTPGAMALFGVAGLCVARRRRA